MDSAGFTVKRNLTRLFDETQKGLQGLPGFRSHNVDRVVCFGCVSEECFGLVQTENGYHAVCRGGRVEPCDSAVEKDGYFVPCGFEVSDEATQHAETFGQHAQVDGLLCVSAA